MNTSRSARRWFMLGTGLAAMAICAVVILSRRGTVMRPSYRFVDPRTKAGAAGPPDPLESLYPLRASISDETRHVLFAYPTAALLAPRLLRVPPDGRLSFSAELPRELRAAERTVIVPNVKHRGQWKAMPTSVSHVERADGRRFVKFDLTLRPEDAGAEVKVRADGVAITDGDPTPLRTVDVRVPSAARLDFGFGILQPAWTQGPVEFRLSACAGEVCDTLFSEMVDPGTPAGQSWQNGSVSLDHLAWKSRAFLFETRRQHRGDDGYSLPVWSNPTLNVAQARSARDTNVILLSIDTLSAQHMTSYGHEHNTAPFIDQTFGKGGVIFENCVAASATTPSSHMTMFTSVQPCIHGIRTGFEGLPLWLTTLAATLRRAGFETGAFTEDGWLNATVGFDRGFDSYAENKSPDIMTPLGQIEVTFGQAERWIAHNREKRFFLFLHTFQVHAPYTPPKAYLGLFPTHEGQPVTAASPSYVRDFNDYDREIRYTDDQLRLLFETIKANGLEKNTIFILISDHGEEFAEHGLLGHGTDLYQEVTRVPLMFWGPGHIPAGRRVAQPVGHIDLMPTILDLAGVPVPLQASGVSLVPLLFGRGVAVRLMERPLFSEAWGGAKMLPDNTWAPFDRPAYMVQIGSRKLSRYRQGAGFSYHYYNVANDPQERQDLYSDGVEGIGDLRELLDTYENACRAQVTRLIPEGFATVRQAPTPITLSPGTEEKLRALGYLK